MKKNAVALRTITNADESFAAGDVILGLAVGQFNDWSAPGVDIVREATAAEVAKAKGERAKAATRPKRARKPKVVSPPPAASQVPPVEPATPPLTDA